MISLRDVHLTYTSPVETVAALDGVDLDVLAGEFVAVFGTSGSGKTTLLNVIAGLQQPDSGTALVNGRDIAHLREPEQAALRLKEVGVVFQDNNLIPEFTAQENVVLPVRARGMEPSVAALEARGRLAQVGLSGLERRYPSQLSGGQKQRVGIARALAGDRMILLADEPTGALDSETSRAIFDLLRSLADTGICIVLATHDPLVRAEADRILTMTDGRIVESAVSAR